MSAINGYADLLVTAGEYSGRNDVAHLFSRFLGMAETKLNRRLRVGEMEQAAVVAVAFGAGSLPADFIEARSVSNPAGCVLRSLPLQVLMNRDRTRRGIPDAYAVQGRSIAVRPAWNGTLTVFYYAAIPPLRPANPSNWLLETAPDVYLYALVEEIAIWAKDAASASAAASFKEQAIKSLAVNDERARFGQNKVSIGGPTP
ncbi:hypothetical protein [Phyllobacterium sp. OV277]|uniref:phage adaptor protein n=1 Tax=Phyllobacterium sp. OV277 TaxID=1882772 RepID=UPI00089168B5|nr:hypothetical protein [Phyllobacterium sp. OV277]SDP08500.1 hypothetical protein SAMN05443582_103360 [Phyllobacterium sp. OV277]